MSETMQSVSYCVYCCLVLITFSFCFIIVIMKHNTKDQLLSQKRQLLNDHSNATARAKILAKNKALLLPIDEVSMYYDYSFYDLF